jgi:broad specificity phosphatase PhoE
MEKIFIVRHGQDQDNAQGILNGHRDTSLTELGKRQAHETASKLVGKGISTIFSGPQLRHRDTAHIISETLGSLTVTVRDDLVERDFGILTGKPLSDIPTYAKEIIITDGVNYFLDAEGSESFESVFNRARGFLMYLQSQSMDGGLLIVTSGDIGKMIRAAYYNWSWQEGLKTSHFDNAGIIELGTPLRG